MLSSLVRRAKETTDTLAPAMGIGQPIEDCALCEFHLGEADGMSWEEFRRRGWEFDLAANPTRHFAPGGENWDDATRRVLTTLERLANDYRDQTLVAVTHAGFIAIATIALFNIPRAISPHAGRRARIDPTHTSLAEWRLMDGMWQLARYNDVTHLNRAQAGRGS